MTIFMAMVITMMVMVMKVMVMLVMILTYLQALEASSKVSLFGMMVTMSCSETGQS